MVKAVKPASKTQNKINELPKRGRPRIERDEPLLVLQTRVPVALRDYIAGLGRAQFGTMQNLYEHLFNHFLESKPYDKGLKFRTAKTPSVAPGWVQLNMLVPAPLGELIKQDAAIQGISTASYCYTALFYMAKYLYPPAQ